MDEKGSQKIHYTAEERARARNNRDRYKGFLLQYIEEHLTPTPKAGRYHYTCPFAKCDTGTKGSRTGAFTYYPNTERFYCHACENGGDIYDLMQQIEPERENAPDPIGAYLLAERRYKGQEPAPRVKATPPDPPAQQQDQKTASTETESDWRRQFDLEMSCPAWYSKEGRAYLTARGITGETSLQFDLKHDTSEGKNVLIIPYKGDTAYFYNSRNMKPDAQVKYYKHGRQTRLFNQDALYTHGQGHLFITEGEIDAMSITQAGGQAIALGSTGGADLLIRVLAEQPTQKPLILALDQDAAGQGATDKASEGLARLGIPHSTYHIGGAYHDANDLLVKGGQQALAEEIHKAIEHAQQAPATPTHNTDTQQTTPDPYRDRVSNYLPQYTKAIKEGTKLREPTPTGFRPLDDALSGGIFTGFYIVGADSNIGKTTLLLQLADNIASQGRDIAYYSFEQSRDELITKSIARIIFQQQIESVPINKRAEHAKAFSLTPLEILKGNTEGHQGELERAIAYYRDKISHNLYLSDELIPAEEIEARTEAHAIANAKQGKKPPLVIIDYFQILPYGQGQGGEIRQHLDRAIGTLRRIATRHKTAVIIISSTNRPNYNKDAGLSALKETSALEYGADIVAMLTYTAAMDGKFTEKAKRAEREKDSISIAFKLIKGRLIKANTAVSFNFYPRPGYFESETTGQSIAQKAFLSEGDNTDD